MDLANDISLGQITYYNKSANEVHFAGSLRYFGFGDIELRETEILTEFREQSPK
jgi:hypothetical protein